MELTFLNSFYQHPDYIHALSEHIKSQLPNAFDQLIFAYQGIPERQHKLEQLRAKNNKKVNLLTYQDQCISTSQLVREQLNLEEDKFQTAFLSPLSQEKRSEEHTSELQSRGHLVCRLLLEKKKKQNKQRKHKKKKKRRNISNRGNKQKSKGKN